MRFDLLPRRVPSRRSQGGSSNKPARNRYVLWSLPVLLSVLLGVLSGIGAAAVINMPRVDSLVDFTPGLITRLLDREGVVFATYAKEKRVLLQEGEIPELVQNALLAAEDSNFFQHGGIDAEGLFRAVIKNLRQGRLAVGGSTITMQLARRLYLSPKKTWRRKIEEALLAVELEKNFSKQQILTLYCNLMFLGHGNYGMEAAARSYFDKSAADLTLPEAAVLAGILQRPSAYSPYRRPDLVVARRDYVLRRMREEGFIDAAAYEEAIQQPLQVVPPRRKDLQAPYFAEEVRRYLEATYGAEGLLQKGLQVHTTLDPVSQRAAERALQEGLVRLDRRGGWRGPLHRVEDTDLETYELPSWTAWDLQPGEWAQGLVMESDRNKARIRIGASEFELDRAGIEWTRQTSLARVLRPGDVAWFSVEASEEGGDLDTIYLQQEPELEGAVIVLESSSAAVRAMVGGWDFERSSFNRATQAQRQVGSAFKVFVYGAALETGFTAADTIFDAPTVFPGANNEPTYSPRNFYRKYFGITTLRRALELSMNVSSAKLMDMVGAQRVIDFARRCGISSNLPPYPSLALGAAELIPLELAAAYAAVANQGIYVEPFFINRVESADGQTLEEHQPRAHKAMAPEIAFVLGHMLEGVVDRGTAASRLADLELDLAGKTGTTDDYIDAWFVGYLPRFTILVWVGHDVSRTIGRNMTGAAAALPIWRAVVEDGLETGWVTAGSAFVRPPGVTVIPVEYYSGRLPGPGAERTIQEAFVAGTEPARQFDAERARVLQLPWYQQRPFYLAKAGERMPDDVADWTLIQEIWSEEKDNNGAD